MKYIKMDKIYKIWYDPSDTKFSFTIICCEDYEVISEEVYNKVTRKERGVPTEQVVPKPAEEK